MAANPVPVAEDDGDDRGVGGEEALERLRSADPPLYLSPSPELSRLARAASRQLFSSLIPFCPKTPFDRLLAGDGFDAEQIWAQIDSLSRPLVSMLRRELKRIEREPPPLISDGLPAGDAAAAVGVAAEGDIKDAEEEEAAEEEEEDDDDEEEEEEDDEEVVAADDEKGSGIEDRFLKIKELEEYLENDEAKEHGHPERRGQRKEKDEDDEGEEEEDDSELGSFDDDGNEETDSGESARYEDFFESNKKRGGGKSGGGKKEKASSKKVSFDDGLEDSEMDDEQKDDEDGRDVDGQDNALSTHEKQIQKINSKKEQMEKSNLEDKSWTMQGEVTASKRPKNSALEVDLDFEHNVRPAPVITEEVTASLEDLIRKRVIEGQFDDVQKAPALPSNAPKEFKELDENKSKKGLAEIYEDEYAQKAGLASIPLSSSDEQKKEASILFKKLCLKLDAVSHFHFAPKPIIEDMSIQANVPALAMEEIAPVAVSDAAMLAPEEIFKGKGDIKEETELTQVERKRRRANKKRRFKAETAGRAAKKTRGVSGAPPDHPNGKENS